MNVTKFTLGTLTVLITVSMFGCKSPGSRIANWRPMAAWSKQDATDEATALADSAPALPSSQFQPNEASASSVASTSAPASSSTAPAASASVAAAPGASPTGAAPPFEPARSVAQTTPQSQSPAANSTVTPQLSPYSNSGYVASTPAPSSTPAATTAPADAQPPADRYAQRDRYAEVDRHAASATPTATPQSSPAASAPYKAPQVTSPAVAAAEPSGGDRYARYDSPTADIAAPSPEASLSTTTAAATTTPSPSSPAATSSQGAVASVTLPSTPGGYRPGGTSTYNTADTASFNIATRPENAESSRYAPARYPEATPESAPASAPSYNVPSYR